MATIYYETLHGHLVPCKFLGWSNSGNDRFEPVIKMKRSKGGYKTGEVLRTSPRHIVEKAGTRDGFIRVRSVALPARAPENTITWMYP